MGTRSILMRLYSSSAPRDLPCSRKMSTGSLPWYTSTSICWDDTHFPCRRRFNAGSYDRSGARPTPHGKSPESLKRVFCSIAPQYPTAAMQHGSHSDSCSGGSSSAGSSSSSGKTPAGAYTVQLIVSGSNGLSQTANLNLNIQ